MTNLASAPNRSSNMVVSVSSPHGLLFSTQQFTKLYIKNYKFGQFARIVWFAVKSKQFC